MIKTVFLDLYNTIADFQPSRAERQLLALREFGFDVPLDALRRAYVVGEDFWTAQNAQKAWFRRSPEEIKAFYAEYEQVLLAAAGLEVPRDLAGKIHERYSNTERRLVLFDDVLPALSELRRRELVVGLISNTDRDVVPICHDLGVGDAFDFIISSCEVGYEKPDPRVFLRALELAKVEPHEAIHVGDQYKSDVVGARAVGIKPLLIDRNGWLEHLDDVARIGSLTEIVDHL